MASVAIKLDMSSGHPRIPIIVRNGKNNKSVRVNVLPDTGATNTTIDNKFARTLGVEIKKGIPQMVNGVPNSYYRHKLFIQIGNLKPIITDIDFNAQEFNFEVNLLGILTMLQFQNVRYERGTIIFTEYNTTASKSTQVKANYVDAYIAHREYPGWYSKVGKRI